MRTRITIEQCHDMNEEEIIELALKIAKRRAVMAEFGSITRAFFDFYSATPVFIGENQKS